MDISTTREDMVNHPEKQPYCYDPEVGRYIDELQAERDKWKAKFESVLCKNPYVGLVRGKPKRAAAVERLKANPSDDTFEKIIAAAIGCTPLFITTRQTRDMLIDLLTDDVLAVPSTNPSETYGRQPGGFMEEASAEDMVNHPEHYTAGDIECIDAIEASMTSEEFIGYLKGNVLKYLWRYRQKGKPEQDLQKADWYLRRLIERSKEK